MVVISALELPEAMVIGVIGVGVLPWLSGFCALEDQPAVSCTYAV